MPLIFQYGSNCDAERLRARLGDIEDLGRATAIGGADITFRVWSRTNGCAAADLNWAPESGRHAWGVLYRVSEAALQRLRRIEGKFYEEKPIKVRDKDGSKPDEVVVTFLVREDARLLGLWTSAKYIAHIVRGYREHGIPEGWVQHMLDVALETNRLALSTAYDEAIKIERLRKA